MKNKLSNTSPCFKIFDEIIKEINKHLFCENCFQSNYFFEVQKLDLSIKNSIAKIALFFFENGICNFINIAGIDGIDFFIKQKCNKIASFLISSKSFDEKELCFFVMQLINKKYINEALDCILRLDSPRNKLVMYYDLVKKLPQIYPPENLKTLKSSPMVIPEMSRPFLLVLREIRRALSEINQDSNFLWLKYKILFRISLIYDEYKFKESIEDIILSIISDDIRYASFENKALSSSVLAILTHKISRFKESEAYFIDAFHLSEIIQNINNKKKCLNFLLNVCKYLRKDEIAKKIIEMIKKEKLIKETK